MNFPKLYIVATPIGNLEDLSPRAIRILQQVDLIAAEDTRHSGHLLNSFGIRKQVISYHAFSEAKRVPKLLEELKQGRSVALISDAGMPGLNDPGERLIRSVIEAGFPLELIPGPSAPIVALVGSGLPVVPFYFGGFLPLKSFGRKKELTAAGSRDFTSVYFESPYRIERMLQDACEVIPTNPICLARELTKKFEQFQRGLPEALLKEVQAKKPKGEYCVIIGALAQKKRNSEYDQDQHCETEEMRDEENSDSETE